jgi:hypothetical protein
MDVTRFNRLRAEEERRKAASAESEEARRGHDELAAIFEARAAARAAQEQATGR